MFQVGYFFGSLIETLSKRFARRVSRPYRSPRTHNTWKSGVTNVKAITIIYAGADTKIVPNTTSAIPRKNCLVRERGPTFRQPSERSPPLYTRRWAVYTGRALTTLPLSDTDTNTKRRRVRVYGWERRKSGTGVERPKARYVWATMHNSPHELQKETITQSECAKREKEANERILMTASISRDKKWRLHLLLNKLNKLDEF